VRENLPDVCVPELPEDPAEYLEYLYSLNLFETASVSENDAERTKQYQLEAQRSSALESFTNVEDFLKSMNMISDVRSFDNFSKHSAISLFSVQLLLTIVIFSFMVESIMDPKSTVRL